MSWSFEQGGIKGRHAVHFTLVNLMDMNPDKRYKAHTRSKRHHGAIHVVDMAGAQDAAFEFYQTLNDCAICFNTIPRSTSKRSSTSGTKQRHTHQDSRRGCTHIVKQIVGDRTVEKDKGTSVAKVIGRDILPERTPCAVRTTKSTREVATKSKQRDAGRPSKR